MHIPVLLGTDIGQNLKVFAAIIAVLVMIAEAIAWRGLDNLFIPVLVLLLLNRLMDVGNVMNSLGRLNRCVSPPGNRLAIWRKPRHRH